MSRSLSCHGLRDWLIAEKAVRKEEKNMNDQSMQAGQLLENEAVRQFLQLLMENRPDKGQDYSIMLWQMDNMENQLNRALEELHEVKGQLAEMQENPAKRFVSRMADAVEGRLHAAQEYLAEMKGRIVEGAREAVEDFKRTGVKALDRAVSALGIKKALESMQRGIGESIADVKKSIEKVENLGHELRSVGGHIKNAGRAIMGKERQTIDGGSEGSFQAAVLSPLRLEKTILTKLNNMALAAIGNMERLEQAAGHTKEESVTEAEQEEQEALGEIDDLDVLEPPPDKEKEKPSVLRDLQEKKAQAAAYTPPVPDKGTKSHEAAL